MNRYYSLAAVINPNQLWEGLTFFQWQGWTGLIGCMLAEGILQIRLYALYSLNKKILALMLVVFIASTATSAWIMGTALSSVTATAVQIPGGAFCVPANVTPHFYAFWIPMLAFETLLCTSLLEVPVGFSLAMSCVLANRVVLNVRVVSREIDASRVTASQKPLTANSHALHDASFCSPGTLTEYEMARLRTMRAESKFNVKVPSERSDDFDSPPFTVL
ncbi:hypothetical protein JR316_0010288 [Psilocybe cubensis]|uniref:Uncharacterized protein n=2 Tax=Psilocybe cubensis TaxID=181762 RepID=A0ACB8GR63_PSICU|nr:hypothetical protein JR316_0010288 [Psilocybe cubensis]KAH9478051.1 hypothetical protein JR316_0010288 [Psilocybe cubensis]